MREKGREREDWRTYQKPAFPWREGNPGPLSNIVLAVNKRQLIRGEGRSLAEVALILLVND